MKRINILSSIFVLMIVVSQLYSKSGFGPTSQKPAIDGIIENIYNTGIKFSSFKQIEPEIFADPSYQTEIQKHCNAGGFSAASLNGA